MNTIGLVLLSSLATPEDVAAWALAVRGQLRNHVAPAWGIVPPVLTLYETLLDVPADVPLVAILDDSDHASALGYHSETPDGRPFGRVFINDSRLNGSEVSVTLSHEAIEMVINPNLSTWDDSARSGVLWSREACDACQTLTYAYRGVEVSDFLFPSFFDPRPEDDAVFDYLRVLSAPFTLARGGYSVVRDAAGHREVKYSRGIQGEESAVEHLYVLGRERLLGPAKLHPASRTQRLLKSDSNT